MININTLRVKPSGYYREYFRIITFVLTQETEFYVSYYYFWAVWLSIELLAGLTREFRCLAGKSQVEGFCWHNIWNNPKMFL